MTLMSSTDCNVGLTRLIWSALAANFLWINASEVFRYFVLIMPMMREAFPQIADIAPMNFTVFMIWGLWDTILVLVSTLLSWLIIDRFGNTISIAIFAGTAIWLTIFVILWLGLFNMNLATASIAGVALPLAWLEMVVSALIVRYFHSKSIV